MENKPVVQQTTALQISNSNDLKKYLFSSGKKMFLSQISSQKSEIAEEIFNKEAAFAMQLIENMGKGKDFFINCVNKSPNSFLFAIANVASSELTLNPDLKLAYLIPRDGKIVYQSSYMGKIEKILQSGLVKSIYAELVYENDKFMVRKGTNKQLIHEPDYFTDRGQLKGAYAVAELTSGAFEFVVMSLEDVRKIQTRSKSSQAAFSPWKSDEGEMIKKTLINRIFKTIPKLKSNPALLAIIKSENEVQEVEVIQETKNVEFFEED